MGIISSAMLNSWEEMGYSNNDNSEELEKLKKENEILKKQVKELKVRIPEESEDNQ